MLVHLIDTSDASDQDPVHSFEVISSELRAFNESLAKKPVIVVATKLDPAVFTVGDLLTEELVAANEDQGVFETIQQMRLKGIRRVPVVDREGRLVGILSLDDLIQLLAEEMSELAKLITREQAREASAKI